MLEVESGIRQLNAITEDDLELSDDEDGIELRAPAFASFFERLRTLMSENVPPESQPAESMSKVSHTAAPTPSPVPESPDPKSSRPKKHSSSLEQSPVSSKKIRLKSPESEPLANVFPTPHRPTVPKSPQYSGDSIESIDEDNTKLMISTFIEQTIGHLGKEFRGIQWPSYARKCRLKISGYESHT